MRRSQVLAVAVAVSAVCMVAPARDARADYQSPTTAGSLSIVGTLVPMAIGIAAISESGRAQTGTVGLMALGAVFGPGLGHAYAGDTGHFWKGSFVRIMGGALGVSIAAISYDYDEPDGSIGGAAIGASIVAASAIYDMATAPRAARDHNRRDSTDLSVAPMYLPQEQALGVTVGLRW